jgi:AcrR family transcriptional regulator
MSAPADLLAPPSAGPARLGRADVEASQRGRLLRAMAEAAAEKGYAHVVVADVVARAGVSRKTFYEQFADKEACFLAAYDACVAAMLGAVDPSRDAALAPADQVSRLLRTYLDRLAAEPALAKTYLVEVYAAGPGAVVRRQQVFDRFVDLVADVHARSGSPSAPLPRLRYEALAGAISTMVTLRVAAGRSHELPDLHQTFVELVLDAFAPFPTP